MPEWRNGRRARLKIVYRKVWEFKSPLRHKYKKDRSQTCLFYICAGGANKLLCLRGDLKVGDIPSKLCESRESRRGRKRLVFEDYVTKKLSDLDQGNPLRHKTNICDACMSKYVVFYTLCYLHHRIFLLRYVIGVASLAKK
ncbi:MAG: hypothetical protein UV60_C0002G0077 [Parcubacteria group bacterium GW2011_GWA2_43_11]|nr:MAG: hypothetical protein UV60_C0002G0077 [Parcubacteria group bacterium GW2011_GWA2_43_11]